MIDTSVLPAVYETIVVEGRDDRSAVERSVKAAVIETHGFGISEDKWQELEAAYRRTGLVIFTDPDFSGEKIRARLTERFPEAKQAWLTVDEAEKNGDIGIENACPEDIRRALGSARVRKSEESREFGASDLAAFSGGEGAAEFRRRLGKELGIGYANASAFIKKLNRLGISREEFEEACRRCSV